MKQLQNVSLRTNSYDIFGNGNLRVPISFYTNFVSLFLLFIHCFLAATILPFPSEATFIYLLKYSDFSPFLLITVASLGNCLGGVATFYIGKLIGAPITLDKHPKKIQFIQRFGGVTALLSWVPFLGDPLLILLGILKAKLLPVLFWMCIGKIVRYLFLALTLA